MTMKTDFLDRFTASESSDIQNFMEIFGAVSEIRIIIIYTKIAFRYQSHYLKPLQVWSFIHRSAEKTFLGTIHLSNSGQIQYIILVYLMKLKKVNHFQMTMEHRRVNTIKTMHPKHITNLQKSLQSETRESHNKAGESDAKNILTASFNIK